MERFTAAVSLERLSLSCGNSCTPRFLFTGGLRGTGRLEPLGVAARVSVTSTEGVAVRQRSDDVLARRQNRCTVSLRGRRTGVAAACAVCASMRVLLSATSNEDFSRGRR